MNIADQYDAISGFYDILYGPKRNDLAEREFMEQLAPVLRGLPPSAAILDASCGHGVQACALARLSYNVTGTDISAGMITLARERAASMQLEITFQTVGWSGLSKAFEESSFDLLLCWGNSLSHAAGAGERRETLGIFRRLLRDSGILVVHSRDWEEIMASRPRYTIVDAQKYQGRTCIPLYIWNWAGIGKVNTVDVVFQFLNDDLSVDTKSATFEFAPFRKDALLQELEGEGFEVGDIYTVSEGFYFITGIKTRTR